MKNKVLSSCMITALSLGLSGCFAPLIVAGAAGAGAANVSGSSLTVSQQVADAKIKTQAIAILNKMNNQLEYQSNIEITVFNGIVLILGQAPNQSISNQIANKIANLKNVSLVYNQLQVGKRVSLSTYSNDTWITAKVKGNMLNHVNPLHFKIVTSKGIVYLMGKVTHEEGSLASNIARQTSSVKHVVEVYTYIASTPAANTLSQTDSEPASATNNNSAETSPASINNGQAGSDASD